MQRLMDWRMKSQPSSIAVSARKRQTWPNLNVDATIKAHAQVSHSSKGIKANRLLGIDVKVSLLKRQRLLTPLLKITSANQQLTTPCSVTAALTPVPQANPTLPVSTLVSKKNCHLPRPQSRLWCRVLILRSRKRCAKRYLRWRKGRHRLLTR